ncbi:hypothetical protein [Priestia megaterium]|uniref:Uncharacterized protein n=1 Tax=Priestia megaterium TaxID=1404 RepID=A0A6M6EBS2_PRIMG|nr:hypothetical protein [Priestia megaterium]QJX80955.1 hypothetical protein FDZ14_33230 [Priestia megaterium]
MKTSLIEEKTKTHYMLHLEKGIVQKKFYVQNTGTSILFNDFSLTKVDNDFVLFKTDGIYAAYQTIFQREKTQTQMLNSCYVIDLHGVPRCINLDQFKLKVVEKPITEEDFIKWF